MTCNHILIEGSMTELMTIKDTRCQSVLGDDWMVEKMVK